MLPAKLFSRRQTCINRWPALQANNLVLEKSRLEVRLRGARADAKAANARAKKSALRLAELTAKEDAAR